MGRRTPIDASTPMVALEGSPSQGSWKTPGLPINGWPPNRQEEVVVPDRLPAGLRPDGASDRSSSSKNASARKTPTLKPKRSQRR